jgi:hypothetical protein
MRGQSRAAPPPNRHGCRPPSLAGRSSPGSPETSPVQYPVGLRSANGARRAGPPGRKGRRLPAVARDGRPPAPRVLRGTARMPTPSRTCQAGARRRCRCSATAWSGSSGRRSHSAGARLGSSKVGRGRSGQTRPNQRMTARTRTGTGPRPASRTQMRSASSRLTEKSSAAAARTSVSFPLSRGAPMIWSRWVSPRGGNWCRALATGRLGAGRPDRG